jgi:hypothetical protein
VIAPAPLLKASAELFVNVQFVTVTLTEEEGKSVTMAPPLDPVFPKNSQLDAVTVDE